MTKIMHESEGMGDKSLLPKATLTRTSKDGKRTLGVMSVTKENGYAWVCKTLELPDKDNKRKISCIPEGFYDCKFTYSPHFKKHLYLVSEVPNRSGVRIHSANYTRQLLGCIALGNMHKDIDGDGITDVLHSGKTMEDFEKLMKGKPFKLQIQ